MDDKKMSFQDFVSIFGAYQKYLGKSDIAKPSEPTAPAQVPAQPAVEGSTKAIMQTLADIQAKLDKTAVPTAQEAKPVGVEDVIAKMFGDK